MTCATGFSGIVSVARQWREWRKINAPLQKFPLTGGGCGAKRATRLLPSGADVQAATSFQGQLGETRAAAKSTSETPK